MNRDQSVLNSINPKYLLNCAEEEIIHIYDTLGLFFSGVCPDCGLNMTLWKDCSKSYANES
jgi:hypothetical protein